MGFRAPSTIFKLNFKGELEGLEVATKSVPTGDLMDLMRMAVSLGSRGSDIKPEDMDAVNSLFAGFAKALLSWNLEDEEGEPIPATLEGIVGQEFNFVIAIIMTWVEAVAGVNIDLEKDSPSGKTSMEGNIPMELL